MKNPIFENALWIWGSDDFGINEYSEFVESLDWSGAKTTVRLSVSGDYTLFINGQYAASNQYGDFEYYKVYDEIDITPFLRNGENRICFLVWYFSESGFRWFTPTPGLLYEIVCGDETVKYSSEKTLSRKSIAYANGVDRKISNQLGYSFIYDAAKEDNWLTGDEYGFKKSSLVEKETVLFKRPIKKLNVGEIEKGVIKKTENSFIIDLGREVVGFPSFSISSEGEQLINVAYGEILVDGHVKRKLGARDFSFDYIAKDGENNYTNYMLRFACRYIEITSEKPIEIEYAGLLPHYYPVTVARELPPLSEEDEKIYEICLNTLRLCMLEHYVDCPWREQALYAFDSRNQMLAGYDAFEDGNFDYARANLLLIGKDNRKDGILTICVPSNDDFTIPSFSLWYVIAVKEYLCASGDLSLGREVFEKTKNLIKAFLDNSEDGLVQRFIGENYWNFYDWSPHANFLHHKERKPDIPLNCLVILALEAFSVICGKLSEENVFEGKAEEIRTNLSGKFFDKEKKLFYVSDTDTEPTELSNSLAVLAGIAGENTEFISDALAEGKLTQCSLSAKVLKYDALIKTDKEKYKDAIFGEIRELYTKMLSGGTGTVWETKEGAEAFSDAGSLCHGWSAIPIYYYWIYK